VAHVQKRETSRGVRYDVRYRGTDGRERSKTFRTRRDADRFVVTTETDKLHGTWADPKGARVTLEEYATSWLATRNGLRPRTRETYESQLHLHVLPELGAFRLNALAPQRISEWHHGLVTSHAVSPNTAAKCYRMLRTILNTAVADELLARNPCQIEHGGVEHAEERPTATVPQVWQLADAMPPRLRTMLLLAGFCGLRLGELLGLERRHVNVLHGLLTVEQQEHQLRDGTLLLGPPKSAAGHRTIALPPFLVPELEAHLHTFAAPEPNGRVFPGERGGPLRRHVVQEQWARARATVKLPAGFRFHDLRHTANTLTAAAGASTRELMHRMGHASPQAALRYQHATRARDTAIAQSLGALIEAAGARDRRGMEVSDDERDAESRAGSAR
jgi:integrase